MPHRGGAACIMAENVLNTAHGKRFSAPGNKQPAAGRIPFLHRFQQRIPFFQIHLHGGCGGARKKHLPVFSAFSGNQRRRKIAADIRQAHGSNFRYPASGGIHGRKQRGIPRRPQRFRRRLPLRRCPGMQGIRFLRTVFRRRHSAQSGNFPVKQKIRQLFFGFQIVYTGGRIPAAPVHPYSVAVKSPQRRQHPVHTCRIIALLTQPGNKQMQTTYARYSSNSGFILPFVRRRTLPHPAYANNRTPD